MKFQQILTPAQKQELSQQCLDLPDGSSLVLITTSADAMQQHSTIFASPIHAMLSIIAIAESIVENTSANPDFRTWAQVTMETAMLISGCGIEASVDIPPDSARH